MYKRKLNAAYTNATTASIPRNRRKLIILVPETFCNHKDCDVEERNEHGTRGRKNCDHTEID